MYRLVQEQLAAWLAPCDEDSEYQVSAHVEREPRAYLECGILAHGFARAYSDACVHDFLIAFSCKGRGICPSCVTKRMSFAAAHLVSAMISPVPVRQWVLSVPKWLRYFLAREGEFLNPTIALAIRRIEQCLRLHTSLADPAARLGAVVSIQRFGSLLNAHTHLHLIVLDGLRQDNPSAFHRLLPLPTRPSCTSHHQGAFKFLAFGRGRALFGPHGL